MHNRVSLINKDVGGPLCPWTLRCLRGCGCRRSTSCHPFIFPALIYLTFARIRHEAEVGTPDLALPVPQRMGKTVGDEIRQRVLEIRRRVLVPPFPRRRASEGAEREDAFEGKQDGQTASAVGHLSWLGSGFPVSLQEGEETSGWGQLGTDTGRLKLLEEARVPGVSRSSRVNLPTGRIRWAIARLMSKLGHQTLWGALTRPLTGGERSPVTDCLPAQSSVSNPTEFEEGRGKARTFPAWQICECESANACV